MTLLSLYLVGRIVMMGGWYNAGLAAGAAFFIYHLYLIRNRDRGRCFDAFLNNHYFGLVVFDAQRLEVSILHPGAAR